GSSALAAAAPSGAAAGRPVNVLRPAAAAAAYGSRGRRVLARLRSRRGAALAVEALYGYEAMRLTLDAIGRAGGDPGDRRAVTREALRPRLRRSPLGDYRVLAGGDVATVRFAAYRREGGRLRYLGPRGPAPAAAAAAGRPARESP
ncbi:MAG TPA: hypothetical protein VF545_01570, partial [Thermoleophilaceae bacterium]